MGNGGKIYLDLDLNDGTSQNPLRALEQVRLEYTFFCVMHLSKLSVCKVNVHY